jgi:hypothetical protein
MKIGFVTNVIAIVFGDIELIGDGFEERIRLRMFKRCVGVR